MSSLSSTAFSIVVETPFPDSDVAAARGVGMLRRYSANALRRSREDWQERSQQLKITYSLFRRRNDFFAISRFIRSHPRTILERCPAFFAFYYAGGRLFALRNDGIRAAPHGSREADAALDACYRLYLRRVCRWIRRAVHLAQVSLASALGPSTWLHVLAAGDLHPPPCGAGSQCAAKSNDDSRRMRNPDHCARLYPLHSFHSARRESLLSHPGGDRTGTRDPSFAGAQL